VLHQAVRGGESEQSSAPAAPAASHGGRAAAARARRRGCRAGARWAGAVPPHAL